MLIQCYLINAPRRDIGMHVREARCCKCAVPNLLCLGTHFWGFWMFRDPHRKLSNNTITSEMVSITQPQRYTGRAKSMDTPCSRRSYIWETNTEINLIIKVTNNSHWCTDFYKLIHFRPTTIRIHYLSFHDNKSTSMYIHTFTTDNTFYGTV